MSSEPPPGCNLECLRKWFEDNQGNAQDIQQMSDGGKELYWHLRDTDDEGSPELLAALSDLIKDERKLHADIKKLKAKWRKALGYTGQGLPASELAEYS